MGFILVFATDTTDMLYVKFGSDDSPEVLDHSVQRDAYGHLVPSMTEFVCMSGCTFFVASAL